MSDIKELKEDLKEQINVASEKLIMCDDPDEKAKWTKIYTDLMRQYKELDESTFNKIMSWIGVIGGTSAFGLEVYNLGCLYRFNFMNGKMSATEVKRVLDPLKRFRESTKFFRR